MAESVWQRQWDIFHAAIELPAEDRVEFVTQQCGADGELRDKVLALVAGHESTNALLDEPVASNFDFIDDTDPASLIGTQVDGYLIESVVGEGGMGVVYLARQDELDRRVALKLIRLGMDTRQVVARFEAERHALALMNHPNIAQVLDAGATEAGRPYFVMEYVDGVPITEFCDEERLGTGERLRLFIEVCAGLQHAHQKGIIHRDMKPSNVLIATEDGRSVPKIIDFGIAKATGQRTIERNMFTQAGIWIGTPEYMSPEQAGLSELDVDTRTDVYSLGVLLYELLVGALPFEPDELRRAGYDEIRRRIREDEPARPSARLSTLAADAEELARNRSTSSPTLIRRLRGDLDWIAMRALEKNPDRRYASPSEFAADLLRHLRDEPVQAGPPSRLYRIRKFARRHTLGVAAGLLIVLSLAVGLSAATFGLVRAQQAERLASQEARTAEEVSNFLTSLFRVSEPSAVDVDSITAREVLDRGVERIRTELVDEPEVRSRLLQDMGRVYAQLGILDEAESLYREALDVRRSEPEASEARIAEPLAGLAGVVHLAGNHEDAVALYKEAIAMAKASDADVDALWLATVYRSLGGVHDSLSQLEESVATLTEARQMLVDLGHSDTAEYARVMRNLGITRWSEQNFEAARSAYEESLRVYDAVLEPGHPEVSYVVNSLAILNYNLGDFEAARPMFERELENLTRTLGPEHRNTASIMNNLGLLLMEMNLLDEARPLINESLRIRETVLGDDHEEVATSLFNLAKLQRIEQDPAAAMVTLERCLEIRINSLGPTHPYVAGTLEQLAETLELLGESEQAEAARNRAKLIRAPQG